MLGLYRSLAAHPRWPPRCIMITLSLIILHWRNWIYQSYNMLNHVATKDGIPSYGYDIQQEAYRNHCMKQVMVDLWWLR